MPYIAMNFKSIDLKINASFCKHPFAIGISVVLHPAFKNLGHILTVLCYSIASNIFQSDKNLETALFNFFN